jgi:hypothetical protein
VTGVVTVESTVVDSPGEFEYHGFLLWVETGVFGEEMAIKAGQDCLVPQRPVFGGSDGRR